MSLADVMQPAIRLASRGFTVTPYLHDCIDTAAADLATDKLIADRYMPGGTPLKAGSKLVQGDYAESLTLIAQQGEAALHGGPLGDRVDEVMKARGGYVSREDLVSYKPVEREPIRGNYRELGNHRPAAAGRFRGAYRADAEHPGRLRHPRARLRQR